MITILPVGQSTSDTIKYSAAVFMSCVLKFSATLIATQQAAAATAATQLPRPFLAK